MTPKAVDTSSDGALHIRPASGDDARLFFEWANDADVRAASFEEDPIAWDDHVAWFRARMHDPASHLYVLADADGGPVAQVRFQDLDDGVSTELSFSVAAEDRGKGYASPVLRMACAQLARDSDATLIVAHVKPESTASVHAFERAGFTHRGTEYVRGHDAVTMTLRL